MDDDVGERRTPARTVPPHFAGGEVGVSKKFEYRYKTPAMHKYILTPFIGLQTNSCEPNITLLCCLKIISVNKVQQPC